jgi:S-formylglutathione hydrolase FrmB
MAFFQMNYHSDALGMGVSVNVILPESAKTLIGMQADGSENYKTLYLLHGLSDDHTIWMRRTSIERYASEYGIAVVMPCVARSWYTDTADGAAYLTFVAKELPDACRGFFRGMSDKREDTLIAGLSMGGYGAFKAALTYPERFGGCASLSGTLDIADATRRRPLNEWRGIFGFDLESPAQLKDTQHDLFFLANELVAQERPQPKMYFWCGEQDHNFSHNERMNEHLISLGIEHLYAHSEGDHSWRWWDLHIQDALRYLLTQ